MSILRPCAAEMEGVRRIVRRGTSADRQAAVYNAARERDEDRPAALREVVRGLVAEFGP